MLFARPGLGEWEDMGAVQPFDGAAVKFGRMFSGRANLRGLFMREFFNGLSAGKRRAQASKKCNGAMPELRAMRATATTHHPSTIKRGEPWTSKSNRQSRRRAWT